MHVTKSIYTLDVTTVKPLLRDHFLSKGVLLYVIIVADKRFLLALKREINDVRSFNIKQLHSQDASKMDGSVVLECTLGNHTHSPWFPPVSLRFQEVSTRVLS